MNITTPLAVGTPTVGTPAPGPARMQDGSTMTPTESRPAPAVDAFSASAPPAVAPTPADIAATSEAPSPARSALAQGTFVGVMLAASLLGGCASTAQAWPTLPASTAQSETYVTGRQASEAIDSFTDLQKVAGREGGGLYRTYLGGIVRQEVTPLQAFQTLANGDPVQYVEKAKATPHEIRSFEELHDLHSRVQANEARRTIDEGLKGIRDGIRAIGDAIGDAIHNH